jgi:hypothetical protein
VKDLIFFPWQLGVQTADVPFGLLDVWDIPAEGKVHACADERIQDCNGGDEITCVVQGFMWVHLLPTQISLQKGFPTLQSAEAAAEERARLFGAVFVPSNEASPRS